MPTIQKITSHLWFNDQAEEAAKFYTSIFKNSRIGCITRYSKAGVEIHGQPPGSVMTVEFWIEGQQFLALNGGSHFKFNESISFMVNCDTQQEIDYYWQKLSEGGDEKAQMCGWLKDRFGLSWQVVPAELGDLLTDHNSPKAEKAMEAVMHMKKIDIEAVRHAYEDAVPA